MELEDLALFRAVVRCQSITRAARSFGMTQSTASRHLQRLEQQIGHPLLDRHAVPLVPTPHGERLLRFADATLDRFEALLVEAHDPAALGGELRIAASSAPALGPLGPWMSAFGHRYPGVRIRLRLMGSHAVEREVLAQHVGLGFTGSPPKDCCLNAMAVARDRIRLAVPAEWVGDEGPVVDPDMLARWSFVVRDEDSATWETVLERFQAAGLPLPAEPALLVDSAEAQLMAVRAGVGVAFVSEAIIRSMTAPSSVRVFDVDRVNLERTLYLVSDAAQLMRDPLSFEFRRFVAERVGSGIKAAPRAEGLSPAKR